MIAIGVIDVGSPRGDKIGWAILSPSGDAITGKDLDAFVAAIAELGASWPLAIGFEAPLFIPTRGVALDVLTSRKGEGARPWSSSAGATVTTAALGVVTYTLTQLRERLSMARATTDFLNPPTAAGDALFFEAFVTGTAKGADHIDDALIAATEARRLLCGSQIYRSAIDETDVFSLVGASLLRTGWSTDLGLLAAPCLVVKPGFDHTPAEVV